MVKAVSVTPSDSDPRGERETGRMPCRKMPIDVQCRTSTTAMNANEHQLPDATEDDRDGIELEFRYDDHEDPSEVTIFDPETMQSGATEWITIDEEHAVAVDEVQ